MIYFIERLFNYFVLPVFVAFIFLFAVACIAVPIALLSGWKPPSTIAYEQCMADGQKEYVCYSMVYGRSGK